MTTWLLITTCLPDPQLFFRYSAPILQVQPRTVLWDQLKPPSRGTGGCPGLRTSASCCLTLHPALALGHLCSWGCCAAVSSLPPCMSQLPNEPWFVNPAGHFRCLRPGALVGSYLSPPSSVFLRLGHSSGPATCLNVTNVARFSASLLSGSQFPHL